MNEAVKQAIWNKDVNFLAKYHFPTNKAAQNLTPSQVEIIRKIVYLESKRINISAYTRYGKTQIVAIALCLFIILNRNKKIKLIGPTEDQAGLLRDYMSELVNDSVILSGLADLDLARKDKLNKESSRKRLTFKNGMEYRVTTAHGKGFAAMGMGADIVCFPKNTLINTNKGILDIKDIVDNKIDCKILSYNHQSNKFEYKPILTYFKTNSKKFIKITHSQGSLICTPNHPIYVKDLNYVPAKCLCVNGKIYILKGFNYNYASNKMSYVRQHILHKTKPFKKKETSFLQSQVFFRLANWKKQSSMGWWKKRSEMFNLWKDIFSRLCKDFRREKKSKILQHILLCKSEKAKREEKNKAKMWLLWKRLLGDSCKSTGSILFSKLCEQSPFKQDGWLWKSCLERWNTISSIYPRVQQSIKITDKTKRWIQMFLMWKNRNFMYSSYRLRQEEQHTFKSDNIMCQLPYENELQKRDVEEVLIKRIEEINKREEYVYNLEVKDNNNYFADGILVHNCIDESAMISRESYTKIVRMLGDDPENSILIELYNPWDRDTKAFDHSISDRFERIQIGYEVGIKEGRITQEFVDEMKEEMTSLEFEVLYNSRFPEQSEDAIFNLGRIKKAPNIGIDFEPGIKNLLAKLENVSKFTEFQISNIRKELSQYQAVISADIADKGKDHSVMMWGYRKENFYQMTGCYSEPQTENMDFAGRLINKIKEFGRIIKILVNIDCIGVGVGVVSRVREWVREHGYKNVKVNACHFGEGATKKDRFMNRKAENYFRLQGLLNENHVKTLDIRELTTQLVAMKWEFSSSGKIKIIDPDGYSPDWSDALVYFIWDDKKGLNFAFG